MFDLWEGCLRVMHIDCHVGWPGGRLTGVAPLCNTERTQAVGIVGSVNARLRSDVVTTVQPESGRGQQLAPSDIWLLTLQGGSSHRLQDKCRFN